MPASNGPRGVTQNRYASRSALFTGGAGELGACGQREELGSVAVGSVDAVDERRALKPIRLFPAPHDGGGAQEMVEQRPPAGMSGSVRAVRAEQVDESSRGVELSHRSRSGSVV